MPVSPADLSRALALHRWTELPPLPGRRNHRRAGVLVALTWTGPEGPEAILQLRPRRMRRHASEISFPGGRPEPEDADLVATALREAHEELGITDARVLGRLSSTPLFTSDFRLEPYVAEVPAQELVPDPAEVAEVHRLPLAPLLARDHLHGIAWQAGDQGGISPVFEVGGHVMYGATAHVFHELLGVVARAARRELPPLRGGRWDWTDLPAFRD